jgi:hypothetical protein
MEPSRKDQELLAAEIFPVSWVYFPPDIVFGDWQGFAGSWIISLLTPPGRDSVSPGSGISTGK